MVTSLVAGSSKATRTKAMSRFYIAAAVGEVLGPALAAATTSVDFQLGSLRVDQYNNVGVWTAVLFICAFVLVFRAYDAAPTTVGLTKGSNQPVSQSAR